MKNTINILIIIILILPYWVNSQNIYSAIHLNDKEDIKNELVEKIIEISTFYSQPGKEVKKSIKYFNSNNLCYKEERYKNEKLTARLTYKYDSISNLEKSRKFEQWNKIIRYSKETANYIYDKKNRLIRIEDLNRNNLKFRETKIIPNEKGHPVSMKVFDGQGKQYRGEEKAEYIYNQNKYISIICDLTGNELLRDTATIDFREDYKFDDNKCDYNKSGDLIKSIQNQEEYFIYEHKYDKKGNWKSKKVYKVKLNKKGKEKKRLVRKYERKIIYKK